MICPNCSMPRSSTTRRPPIPRPRQWLQSLSAAPTALLHRRGRSCRGGACPSQRRTHVAGSAVDAYTLAKDALAAGQEEKAFAIMRAEIARQRSGRRRFRRTMQMMELAISCRERRHCSAAARRHRRRHRKSQAGRMGRSRTDRRRPDQAHALQQEDPGQRRRQAKAL